MALYQGIELRILSGSAGTTMMILERLQSANASFEFPRTQIRALNRFRPEINMPVLNYTPVSLSFDYIKSDNIVETALGLVNTTGVICALTNAKSTVGYGVRNFELLQSPLDSTKYIGQFNIQSGVLSSYSISATVGDTVKASISIQALDMGFGLNSDTKTGATNYNTNIIAGKDVSISGISLSGFGISGLSIQSMSLGVSIGRTEISQLGSKFPIDRPMVDASASLQLQGYIEAGNTFLTGLGTYDCGSPVSGTMFITIFPSCGGPGTNYKVVNPYWRGMSQNMSVGGFVSVDLGFSIPLPISAYETGSSSYLVPNLIIS